MYVGNDEDVGLWNRVIYVCSIKFFLGILLLGSSFLSLVFLLLLLLVVVVFIKW